MQKTREGWGEIEQSLPQIARVLFALGLFYLATSLLSESLAQATQGILVHYLPDPT